MFAIILTFALVTAHVVTEIPSYIHICSRQNSNVDQCITNSINSLKDKLCEGIPELESLPLKQFIIDNLVISDTDNAKLHVRDIKITGLCDFNINSLHMDFDKLLFNIDLLMKRIILNGTYDFDIRVLVPFINKGPIYFVTDNVETKITAHMKMVTKDNQKYVYISKMNLNFNVKNLNIKFENEKDTNQLNKIISTFIGSNQEEFINRVRPPIAEKISKQILFIANNIFKHFTYDELYPEQI